MSLNNSLNNSMNEARTDNCEGLSPGRCPASKEHGPHHHQITARMKWKKQENKTAISCYLKATKQKRHNFADQTCEVNEVLKCIPVKNLSDLKYVVRAGALLVCKMVGVKTDHTINKKEPFWK